ncbi:MAG: hypothetical protein K8S97_00850 [Anaerolineae bacterium]|nr:hypothetical protein [Anaerolineae bacterium]
MSSVEFGPDAAQWAARLTRWAQKLHAARLHGFVTGLLDVCEPLGPLGAQLLWIAQPVAGVFAPREDIGALARILDAPGGVAWMREQLDTVHTDGASGSAEHETGGDA